MRFGMQRLRSNSWAWWVQYDHLGVFISIYNLYIPLGNFIACFRPLSSFLKRTQKRTSQMQCMPHGKYYIIKFSWKKFLIPILFPLFFPFPGVLQILYLTLQRRRIGPALLTPFLNFFTDGIPKYVFFFHPAFGNSQHWILSYRAMIPWWVPFPFGNFFHPFGCILT